MSEMTFKDVKLEVIKKIKQNHLKFYSKNFKNMLLEQKSLSFLESPDGHKLIYLYYFDKLLPFHLKNKLSDKRYNKCLRDSYTIYGAYNIPTKILISLFNKSKKNLIMIKKDLKIYNNFKEIVTIYRGCSPKYIRRPSWSIKKDDWRIRNNPKGILYQAQIKKKYIYCYISEKKEEEVIINPYKLLEKPKIVK